jgi:hypothetical protein
VFLRLNAELNWHHMFQDLSVEFRVSALADRQTAELADAGVPASV